MTPGSSFLPLPFFESEPLSPSRGVSGAAAGGRVGAEGSAPPSSSASGGLLSGACAKSGLRTARS